MVFLIKKQTHIKVEGFNEDVMFMEDIEYLKRVTRAGRYKMFRRPHIYASTRRFEKDGWVISYLKLVAGSLYTLVFGPIKSNMFNYNFNHYSLKNNHGRK